MKKIKEEVIKTKTIFLFILLTLTVLFCLTAVSAANNVYVNTTGNDTTGNGSAENPYLTIQKGIDSVNPNGTINIAKGTYKGTSNTNITINKNLNIVGENQTGTIINGEKTNWIFHIASGVNVTIQNLTITNGNSTDGSIYNQGNLTVKNCTFTNNIASAHGAAIFNEFTLHGILTISDCNFISNTAKWGAVSNGGEYCTITNCNFINNTAINNGGAIANYSPANITLCNFINNTAGYIGGGAIYTDGNLTVNFSRFYNNTSTGPGNAICNVAAINAENNWWGTNNPVWSNLIDGFAQPTNWVILSVKATPNSINNTQTSTVTADFNHINGGSDLVGGHIPDGIPVSFSLTNGPLGTLTLPTACTTNGTASMLFTATSVGVQDVNATLDDQSVTTNITINPSSNLYLNITSNNNNPKLGQTFTITYKLGNYGPDTATNVMITIPLPEGFLVSQITGDGNWTISGNTILWTLKNVPKGDPYLYVSGWSNHAGIIVFSSSISSETYNINTNSVTPLTINTIETAHAASKTEKTNKTIGMQDTGLPIAGLILSILATFGGLVAPRRK